MLYARRTGNPFFVRRSSAPARAGKLLTAEHGWLPGVTIGDDEVPRNVLL